MALGNSRNTKKTLAPRNRLIRPFVPRFFPKVHLGSYYAVPADYRPSQCVTDLLIEYGNYRMRPHLPVLTRPRKLKIRCVLSYIQNRFLPIHRHYRKPRGPGPGYAAYQIWDFIFLKLNRILR